TRPTASLARVPVDALEGHGDHRAPPRAGSTAPPGPASGISGGRPSVPIGRKPPIAAHQLVVFCRHSGDAPALAPAAGGEALDLFATTGSPSDRAGNSSGDRGPGESAVGLSAHRRRAEGTRRRCFGDHREEDPSCRGTRPDGSTARAFMARI